MGFFSSLFDPIKSLLTPPGTNAAKAQQEGQQQFGNTANAVGKEAGQTWADWLKYNRQFTPQLQQGLQGLANSTSQTGLFNSAVRGGNLARSQALSKSVPLMFRSNPELAKAYQAQQLNTANSQGNQAIQQSTSPQAQSQALQQLFAALSGAQNYAYQPFQQAASVSYGTPKVQVGPGLLDMASPFLGNIFGKGSVGNGSSQQYSQGATQGPPDMTGMGWLQNQPWDDQNYWG